MLSESSMVLSNLENGRYRIYDTPTVSGIEEITSLLAAGEDYAFLIDQAVMKHHASDLHPLLDGFDWYSPPACGESVKTIRYWEAVQSWLWRIGFPRSGLLVTIGGGAILDLGGFVAASFRRGIRHLRIGTTLLADVDAALGVKCGLTEFQKKNSVGAFHAPVGSIISEHFMRSLPRREYVAGFAELLKTGLCVDQKLWDDLALRYQTDLRDESMPWDFVRRGASATAMELDRDLWETTLARPLDLGHTISPVIETITKDILHGEAVAIDLCFSAAVGYVSGVSSQRMAERVFETVLHMGLAPWSPYINEDLVREALRAAVLHRGGELNMPIVKDDGGSVEYIQARDLETSLRDALIIGRELSSDLGRRLV